MQFDFPMTSFLQVKQDMLAARAALNKERAAWLAVRGALPESATHVLDEAFKVAFERLEALYTSVPIDVLQEVLLSLHELVQKGASARLLGNDELGTFNLAMLIKHISSVTGKKELELITEIIRVSIIAGADLYAQKAYVGNGGSIGLEWLCLYLAGGMRFNADISTMEQYNCCFNIFPWIVDDEETAGTRLRQFYPFEFFLGALRESPEVAHLQEEMILRWMALKYAPIVTDGQHVYPYYFSRLATLNVHWLTMIFPFEEEPLKRYLQNLQKHFNAFMAKSVVNSFSSSNKARKHFSAFFLQKPHWLLQWIITSFPEMIFDLVNRNEQHLLAPFLKHYKRELAALRNEEGQSLLQYAQDTRGVVKNTIELLRRANLPG